MCEGSVASARWHALGGALPRRLLRASTGVKDKAFDNTRYVVELAGPEKVNTMAQPTLRAVADYGRIPPDSIHAHAGAAKAVLDELERTGIDMANVAATLAIRRLAAFETLAHQPFRSEGRGGHGFGRHAGGGDHVLKRSNETTGGVDSHWFRSCSGQGH